MNHDYGRAQYLPTGKQTTGHWVLYENQYCIHFPFIEHKFSINIQMLVSINCMHLIKLQIPQRTITFSIIAEFSRCKIFPWPASEQHPRSETRAATSEAGPGYLFSEAELHSQYFGETTENTYIHKNLLLLIEVL